MKLLAYLQSCVWVHLSGLRHIQTSTSRTGSRWQRAPHPWAMAHVQLKDLILKNKHCRTYRVCQHFFSEGGNGRKKNAHNCVGTGLRYLVLPSLRPSEIWHSAGIGRILQPWLFELWIYLNSKVYDLHRYLECASWAKYAAFEFHSFSTWYKRRQMRFCLTRILISGCRCITRLNFFLSCG